MVDGGGEMTQYQLLPDLSPEEYQSLKDDIRGRGILVPIEKDEQGNVLDGHHRLRVWQELRDEGVKVPDYQTMIRAGMTEQEKKKHIWALNIIRRHLSIEQLTPIWAEMRVNGMTYQDIAETSGVDETTVLRAVPANAGTQPDFVIGKDGKHYPPKKTHRPKTVVTKNSRESKAVFESLASMPADKLPDNVVDAKRTSKLNRDYQKEQQSKDVQDITIGNAKLMLGDFKERGNEILDASVDLIFTDPPYEEECLPLWKDLSSFAARVLKPEGILIAYSGAMYLPTVLSNLSEKMCFWWTGSIILDGHHSQVFARNVTQGSKPLLFYVRQGYQLGEWFEDTCRSEKEQKDLHDWQQNIGPARYYITKLTKPGALVVDPFLGSGTTGLAAIEAGRNFIGIDNDPVAYSSAMERIQTWISQSKT